MRRRQQLARVRVEHEAGDGHDRKARSGDDPAAGRVVCSEPDDAAGRWWRDHAIRYTQPLELRQFDRDVHDLGFLFMSTYYRWRNLTKDPKLQDVLDQIELRAHVELAKLEQMDQRIA